MNISWITDVVLLLLTVNVVGMLALVALRLIRDRLDRRRAARRDAAVQALIALVIAPAPPPLDAVAGLVGDARLMAEVVLELQVLVRGPDSMQFR